MTRQEASMNSTANDAGSAAANRGVATEQYLSFLLGGQEYGADIRRVQEIKGWDSVTRVPYSPKYVLGVINLRGAIVPVIDLRIRFNLERVPYDSTTVIVVVHVPSERGERTVGIVVDAVADVYNVATENIRVPPDVLGAVERAFVKGLADQDGKLLILLDIELLATSSVLGDTKAA
jgi:purine-binding chemotaxis protein CheW